ncbi:efflux RND transporter periplasmic adaptor subunit [Candidatus Uhrbacteria bacterium]|nr:efflux RND transporter periplasmic adaptor subunit [Candidatus Uhrbacteria bacterium]
MRKVIIPLLILAAIAGGIVWFALTKTPTKELELFTVQRGSVIEEIAASGVAHPFKSVSVSTEVAAKVSDIKVSVGAQVKQGQTLFEFDTADVKARLARLTFDVQNASGQAPKQSIPQPKPTPAQPQPQPQKPVPTQPTQPQTPDRVALEKQRQEIIRAKEYALIELNTAKARAAAALADQYAPARNLGYDAYSRAVNAYDLTSAMFSGNPARPTFTISSSQIKAEVEYQRGLAIYALEWLKGLQAAPSDQEALDAHLVSLKNRLDTFVSYLSRLNDALNASVGLPQATLSMYRERVSNATTGIQHIASTITSRQQVIVQYKTSSQQTIQVAQQTYDEKIRLLDVQLKEIDALLTFAPQNLGGQARVIFALANDRRQASSKNISELKSEIEQLREHIAKAAVVAPVDGTVSALFIGLGDTTQPGKPLVQITSGKDMVVDLVLPSEDIQKIEPGTSAKMTFSALQGEEFMGAVVFIDPVEVRRDGKPVHRVVVAFNVPDERIKDGFTGDISLLTRNKRDVVLVPQTAIVKKDDTSYVRKKEKNKFTDTPVVLGSQKVNDMVEIKAGIFEGDQIVKTISHN